MDPYQNLADAIVLQAVADYRLTNDSRELEELERFFRSEWFGMLTNIDPEYLIANLRSEKSSAGSAEVSLPLSSPRRRAQRSGSSSTRRSSEMSELSSRLREASRYGACDDARGSPFSKTSAPQKEVDHYRR